MNPMRLLECSFLIPTHRDKQLSDGEPHPLTAWNWLTDQLFDHFDGMTVAPGLYEGLWKDPDTGKRISDQSRKYIVALAEDQVPLLRHILAEACLTFQQKCIYLNVAGQVELVEAPPHDSK